MKFSTALVTAIAALSATVFATEAPLEKKQAPSPFNTQSAYLVLATALPSSLVSQAITNPGAVSSEIASDFSQGSTPSWFSALPTDVKSYLQDQGSSISRSASASATGSSNASSASASALPPRPSATGMLPYGTNGTSGPFATGSGASSGLGTVTRPSSSSSSSMGSSSTTTSSSSSSGSSSAGGPNSSGSPAGAGASGGSTGSTSNMAALPTAAIGAGLGAAVGFFSMLAI